jgi:hypothetical protein
MARPNIYILIISLPFPPVNWVNSYLRKIHGYKTANEMSTAQVNAKIFLQTLEGDIFRAIQA